MYTMRGDRRDAIVKAILMCGSYSTYHQQRDGQTRLSGYSESWEKICLNMPLFPVRLCSPLLVPVLC